jgi:hypothetical protein
MNARHMAWIGGTRAICGAEIRRGELAEGPGSATCKTCISGFEQASGFSLFRRRLRAKAIERGLIGWQPRLY